MFILVDTNEQATNPKVVERLQRSFPNLQLTELAFGDINIILDDGNILAIERKRAGDFLGSIGDGRLFNQVERMTNGAKWAIIVIEGQITFNADDMAVIKVEELRGAETTQWKGTSVRAAMLAVQWAGCPIIQTHPAHFPDMVAEIISMCSKPDVHQQLGRKKIISFPPVELKEEIVAAFPGVGLKRSRSLFEFAAEKNDENGVGTLAQAMCWATALNLIEPGSRPGGWGDKTIENFRVSLGLKGYEFLDIREDNQIKQQILSGEKKKAKRKNGKEAEPF